MALPGLAGIGDAEPVRFGDRVHIRAGGKIVRVLLAAMQHDDEAARLARARTRECRVCSFAFRPRRRRSGSETARHPGWADAARGPSDRGPSPARRSSARRPEARATPRRAASAAGIAAQRRHRVQPAASGCGGDCSEPADGATVSALASISRGTARSRGGGGVMSCEAASPRGCPAKAVLNDARCAREVLSTRQQQRAAHGSAEFGVHELCPSGGAGFLARCPI